MIGPMSIVCRKSGFPVECRFCGRRTGRPNGLRLSLANGLKQQIRCSACRRQWSRPAGNVDFLFSEERIHVRTDRLLEAFALMVLGIPMCRVERLVSIKA